MLELGECLNKDMCVICLLSQLKFLVVAFQIIFVDGCCLSSIVVPIIVVWLKWNPVECQLFVVAPP